MQALFVDPPGLEPGLCGTKIRRVANYTMGQHYLIRCCKIRKKFKLLHLMPQLST